LHYRNRFRRVKYWVDFEKKSIEVLNQLVAGEKKMNVRVVFNRILIIIEEKKILGGFRRIETSFDSRLIA